MKALILATAIIATAASAASSEDNKQGVCSALVDAYTIIGLKAASGKVTEAFNFCKALENKLGFTLNCGNIVSQSADLTPEQVTEIMIEQKITCLKEGS